MQKGYPVVTVSRNYTDKSIDVTQEWFILNPLDNRKRNSVKQEWYVPFTFTTKENPEFDFYARPQWLKPNDTKCKYIQNYFFFISFQTYILK